jgi:hypothetical protein
MPRARRVPSKAPSKTPTTPADVTNSILARTSERYQAAERVRRDHGAAWMARQPVKSAEQGAVRLLIGTWDALAYSYTASGSGPHPFFAINPFDLAWEALKPAVRILRETDGPNFAREFERVATQTRAWLNTPEGRLHRSSRSHGGKGPGGKGGHRGKGQGGHNGQNGEDGENGENGDNGQGGGLFL